MSIRVTKAQKQKGDDLMKCSDCQSKFTSFGIKKVKRDLNKSNIGDGSFGEYLAFCCPMCDVVISIKNERL